MNTTRVLKAIANDRRIAIISLLWRQGSMNVSEIAEDIGLSFKSTSRHLIYLYNTDLVEKEQKGLSSVYSLNDKHPIWKKTLLNVIK